MNPRRTTTAALAILLASVGCRVAPVEPPPTLGKLQEPRPAPSPPPSFKDDPACRLFRWPLSPTRAAAILRQTEIFATAAVYVSGEPTPQVVAFNVLMDQKNAMNWFESIAGRSGEVGKLYSLSALWLLAPDRAAELSAELRASSTSVFTQSGCEGGETSSRELVDAMERYAYGENFRSARDRAYAAFAREGNLCAR